MTFNRDDPNTWPCFRPLIIAHDVARSYDRSTAVVGGLSYFQPTLFGIQHLEELPQGLCGSERANALAAVDRRYNSNALIVADLSNDASYVAKISSHGTGQQESSDTSIVPPSPDLFPGQIDKSVLTIAEPKRLRDKAHLRFVASQACLVCGRQPSDPHHLRFAQPRALGLKVSDEFTVPLCRGHHRQLHQAGNEVTWWEDLKINALEVAKGLWEESRTKAFPTAAKTPQQQAPRDPSHADPRQEASKLPNESN
jgi:hypothetical protein